MSYSDGMVYGLRWWLGCFEHGELVASLSFGGAGLVVAGGMGLVPMMVGFGLLGMMSFGGGLVWFPGLRWVSVGF